MSARQTSAGRTRSAATERTYFSPGATEYSQDALHAPSSRRDQPLQKPPYQAPSSCSTSTGTGSSYRRTSSPATGTTVEPAEEWRSVVGFEGRYEVSDQGRVRTAEGYGRVGLRKLTSSGRYLTVCVNVGPHQRRNLAVHRLVCEAFHGPMPEGADLVRHLNDVKHDNRAVNLAWGTHAENRRDQTRNGVDPEASRPSCDNGHPYVEGSFSIDRGARRCLACHRDNERKRYAAARDAR